MCCEEKERTNNMGINEIGRFGGIPTSWNNPLNKILINPWQNIFNIQKMWNTAGANNPTQAETNYLAALGGKANGNVLRAQNMTPAQLKTTIEDSSSAIKTSQDKINDIATGQNLDDNMSKLLGDYQTARSKIEQNGGPEVQAALQQIDTINAKIIELQNQQALTGASGSVSQAAGDNSLANDQNNAANSIQQEITALEQQRAALEAQIKNSVGEEDYKAYAEARDAYGSAGAEEINKIRDGMVDSQMDLSAAEITQDNPGYVRNQRNALSDIRSTCSDNAKAANSATDNIINTLAQDMVKNGKATSVAEAKKAIQAQMSASSTTT